VNGWCERNASVETLLSTVGEVAVQMRNGASQKHDCMVALCGTVQAELRVSCPAMPPVEQCKVQMTKTQGLDSSHDAEAFDSTQTRMSASSSLPASSVTVRANGPLPHPHCAALLSDALRWRRRSDALQNRRSALRLRQLEHSPQQASSSEESSGGGASHEAGELPVE
jgi:hypothetical protein